ncbi:hypothetical protein [uncultured Xanthomonas sp.]|nr:hypothetical protein [uncultured Xanthomonas sp.]
MICPMAVDWGDVATWFSGVAAFSAVVVALMTGKEARRIAQEARNAADEAAAAERARSKAARHDQAVCLALVFHHELWLLHGLLCDYAAALRDGIERADRDELLLILIWRKPQDSLTLLTRMAESFEVFERDTRALLFTALSGWVSIRQAPSAEDLRGAPMEIVKAGAISTAKTADAIATACARAIRAILPLAQEVRPELTAP